VRLILDQLREDYRTVLVLLLLSDLSRGDRQVMGRSAGAVRVYSTALAAMKIYWKTEVRMMSQDEILQSCLELIESGQATPEALLEQYPDAAKPYGRS
jgi:hypothetical protein